MLYACGAVYSGGYRGMVWSVNVSTATKRVERDFGYSYIFISCAIDSSGTMFLIDIIADVIYKTTVGVWAIAVVGTPGYSFSFAQSMSVNYRDEIVVAAYSGTSGEIYLLDKVGGTLQPFGSQPSTNELCAFACPYHVNVTETTTTTVPCSSGSVREVDFPIVTSLSPSMEDYPSTCALYNQRFVCFTASVEGLHIFDTCAGTGDTLIGVYKDACLECPPAGSFDQCNDDGCNFQSSVSVYLLVGESATIEVGTYDDAESFSGDLRLQVIPRTSSSSSISTVHPSSSSRRPPPPPPKSTTPTVDPTEIRVISNGDRERVEPWIITIAVMGGVFGCALIVASAAFFLLRRRDPRYTSRPYQASPYGGPFAQTPSAGVIPSSAGQVPPPYEMGSVYVPVPPEGLRHVDSSFDDGPLPPMPSSTDGSVIPFDEMTIEDEIGRGAFGVVYSARWRGSKVAVKKLLSDVSEKDLDDFKSEAVTMTNLRPHVNVVQMLGICLEPLCIVTEFMEDGSLSSFLTNKTKVHEIGVDQKKRVSRGIAAGMLHLHSEDVVHRDLAARNVLIGTGFKVKIADFGLSRAYNRDTNSNVTSSDTGPLKWMPPEAIRHRQYSKASDVWAFGVTLFELVTRDEPYGDMDAVQVALAVTTENLRLATPPGCPDVLADLIKDCQRTDPDDRPEMEQICDMLLNDDIDVWGG